MPTVQLYHHQTQLHSNPGPHAAATTFGAAQAHALAQTSETLSQIGQKLADTADYRALTEYQLEEQTFQAKQKQWLLDNPNAEKDEILKRHRLERAAFTQTQLQKKHLSARARERIGLMTQDATIKSELAATQAARKREITKAQTLSATVKQNAIDAGDLAAFTLRLDQDIEHGITAPEMREAELNHAKKQIQRGEVMRLINDDPIHAKQLLEERDPHGNPTQFDAIDHATRYTLINHATINSSELAAQTYETLANRIDDGEFIGREELDDLVDRRLMTPKHAKALLKLQTKGKFDTTAHAQLHNAILAYDPALDPHNTQYAEFLGAILSMPSGHATELRALLNDKQKGSASPLRTHAAQEIFKHINERFTLGLYGHFDEYHLVPTRDEDGNLIDEEPKAVKKADPARYEIALANRFRVEDEMRRFIQANPNATGYEMNAHLNAIQNEIMGTTVSEILDDRIPTDLNTAVGEPPAPIRFGFRDLLPWNNPPWNPHRKELINYYREKFINPHWKQFILTPTHIPVGKAIDDITKTHRATAGH